MSLIDIIGVVMLLFLLSLLLSFELTLFDRASSLLPLLASLVVDLALFINARHREHAELAVVQQLTTTVAIATPSLTIVTPPVNIHRGRTYDSLFCSMN